MKKLLIPFTIILFYSCDKDSCEVCKETVVYSNFVLTAGEAVHDSIEYLEFNPIKRVKGCRYGTDSNYYYQDSLQIDLDNDGNYDIAVLPYEEKYWYENNGGYDFTKHEISNTTTAPNDIEIVDLDNDKDKDIVVVNGYNPNYWYENNGQQEFIRHQIHENDNMTYACRVADMNNDGHLDIITGENGGVNYWYENNENENFTAHQIHGNINDTESLDVADFDNDGDVDVLAGNSGSMGIGSVYWYENKGDGDFIAHFVETSDERNNAEVNAKDVNNDGLVDIIIPTPLPESYTDPSYLLWYENKGDGSFISNKKDLGYNAYMVPADLNYDGMDEMYIFNNTMPT